MSVSGVRVVVIGAGTAGLASAYYLQLANIPFVVLERSHEVGHTWNSLYPSLRLNTTKWYSHLPKMPMPWHDPIFPTAKQYHRYLNTFADRHHLRQHIHFGVMVRKLARTPNGSWCVQTDSATWEVDAVISATGRFDQPFTPTLPNQTDFTGRILHAHDYLGAEPFMGQRVMVVGNGPSGVDIAPEIGKQAHQPPVLLSMRTGITLSPRYPWGLPKHAWMILADYLPQRWGRALNAKIASIQFRNLERVGIRTPQAGKTSTAAGTRGDELIRAVKAGQVICVPGLRSFTPDGVILDDGSVHQVEAVIMATGYRPVLYRYLREPVTHTDSAGFPKRDQTAFIPRQDHPSDYPSNSGREVKDLAGLYLVGVFYQGKGALYNCNLEAQIAVDQIKARLQQLDARSPSS